MNICCYFHSLATINTFSKAVLRSVGRNCLMPRYGIKVGQYLEQISKQLFVTFHMFGWRYPHPVHHCVHSLFIKQVQLQEKKNILHSTSCLPHNSTIIIENFFLKKDRNSQKNNLSPADPVGDKSLVHVLLGWWHHAVPFMALWSDKIRSDEKKKENWEKLTYLLGYFTNLYMCKYMYIYIQNIY